MKKIIFILFITHYSLQIANAQQPTQEWIARIPGPSNDLGPFLALDKNGNSYVAGTHVVNDTINILCVKYNTSGVQQWATLYKYPGESFFTPTGLVLDSSGNAYVSARTAVNSFQAPNCLTVKFNASNGSVIWSKKYIGQYGRSYPLDIKIDKLDNIYVVGWSDSSHLIIKYNINGDSIWVRKYNLPGTRDMAYACTIDDSLNVIITGIREYCVTFPPPGGCFDTLLAVKYSTDGVLRWIRTYRYFNNRNASGYKIVTDQNGNIYIGGSTAVSGWGVYLTLKYDRNGVQQWGKIFDAPGSGDNTLKGIAMDRILNFLYVTGGAVANGVQMATTIKYNIANGDSVWVRSDTGTYSRANNSAIVVDSTGSIYTTGGTYILGLSTFDIMTRKYSGQSNPLWMITYNGPYNGNDYGLDLALDNLRNVFVLGTSQGDYIVIKYSQTSGIVQISHLIPNKFYISNFPNPFNSQTTLNIGVPYNSKVSINIYDILGKNVETLANEDIKAGAYKVSWNAQNVSSGIYFCRILAAYSKDNNTLTHSNTIKLILSK